ncbi:2-keto-4-pentenoate hydratase [Zoogloea sp. 1C4]|uniref:2-keto-4-pentenoate hydratase n=1 Tax=Zoogloea sp. 1C4 TaxID=2570190 RepID=UPI001292955A|nr:fumarylacetoacetate hydrolase [Zoogloea sp. 1C4]
MKSPALSAAIALAGLAAAPLAAHAACPTDLEAAAVAAAVVARQPVPAPAGEMSMADGLCGRDKVVRFLAQTYGEVVGYKAGLTNPAVQKRFNHDAPLRGTLFKSMLVADGAELPVSFGTRPVFEADMIVEVADPAALAKADTPLAALKALKSFSPFIELPDLMVADPSKLGGPMLAMINVGARAGVVGKAIPIKATPALAGAFATMTVTLADSTGSVLDTGKGSATLGNPLNAASWLARDLAAAGTPLKRGDLLSLGSFTKLFPPKPGMGVMVKYDGLPGNPGVGVKFR